MKKIPNEGLLSLENIRVLEFGDILSLNTNENELDYLIYDKNMRFTEKRSLEELTFAFTQKTSTN